MHPVKNTTITTYRKIRHMLVAWSTGIVGTLMLIAAIGSVGLLLFENQYKGRVYPTIFVGGVSFAGKTAKDVEAYWNDKNLPFELVHFELTVGNEIATISGRELGLGYDATFSATQAYSVGRSGFFLSDLATKLLKPRVDLDPYYRWNKELLEETINTLAQKVYVPVEDALFQFENGKVVSFKPSRDGQRLNVDQAKGRFEEMVHTLPSAWQERVIVPLAIEVLKPSVATNQVNSFGIKERIGIGYSEFTGSIPGRIHNVILAASRVNGLLIKPGEIFSFNDALGDISAATGYQSAYIIKNGRTVLGDGGGVCQVSTTLFRAAMNAGLPIVERQPHAYRVHYYEEGGFKAGIDATVFAPSVDLKFRNDTPASILIQAKSDPVNLTLTFEFYGTSDGRKSEIANHQVWGITPPPPALYQDDPTLAPGTTKQVDFPAWGAKASFQYKVTRNNETLIDTTFFSNYRPWQAVYLKGV